MEANVPEARIAPLTPPYDEQTAAFLQRWMPPGATMQPLRLFRMLARHPELADRLRPLASHLLGRTGLSLREREWLILRVCALNGAGYEWGVHAAAFAQAAGINPAELRANWRGEMTVELGPRERCLDRLAQALHQDGRIDDTLWSEAAALFSTEQLLDAVTMIGFYHLIAFLCGAFAIEPEPWATNPKTLDNR